MLKTQNFTNHQFGDWTVLGDAPYEKSKGRKVCARCKCGHETIHYLGNLKSGRVKRCKQCSLNSQKRDRSFVGSCFGAWTVVKELEHNNRRKVRVLARCKCGKEKVVRLDGLKSGKSTQCRSCATSKQSHRHGMTDKPEYKIWLGMRSRCNDPQNNSYQRYGGRGVKICDRWNDFESFYADMGDRPSPKHSVERVDVNGDYTPENCCWATSKQQTRNTRRTKSLTYQNQVKPLVQWAEELGVDVNALRARVYTLKWSDDRALSTPFKTRKSPVKAVQK